MVLRWRPARFLEAKKSFWCIQGHKRLWILATVLRSADAEAMRKAASPSVATYARQRARL
jgi:hypothetical protein